MRVIVINSHGPKSFGPYFTKANTFHSEDNFLSIKTLIQRQQVNYIVRSFSAQERAFMGLPKNYIGINPGYWAKGDEVKNIFIEYDHFKPIAFFDITSAGAYLNAAVGVYNSEQYRNKG